MTVRPRPHSTSALPAPEPVPRLLRDLVHERTGLYFEDNHLGLMLEKLEPPAQAQRCGSFLDYYYLLKYDGNSTDAWRRVMDAFSVQETYFWREHDQVQALVNHIVPEWFRRETRPLKIWSAACASGEEPYTLAIALAEAGWGKHPIEIHASDASDLALQKSRLALYRERSFRALPPELRKRYFQSEADGDRLRPEIVARVQFRWANLVDPASYAELDDVHVIFCRNVFIYFSRQAITRAASAFSGRMPAGGYLFIGASESLLRLTDRFELQELDRAFVYRRVAAGASA